jgi:phosphopantothenoylcysteine decarboxylase/phosphopantothenate--cysteine ligase
MRCLVTAGPTYEPLDQVRRLTNFSTGRLGTDLANYLTARGHDVTLLIGQLATWHGERRVTKVETFTTTVNLSERLHVLAGQQVAAVFHAAAVSDFTFGKVYRRSPQGEMTEVSSGKFSTHDGALFAELVPTGKIISQLRTWFPQARLVGWKYEVEGNRESVLRLAREQMVAYNTHACVANGPAYGLGFGLVEKDATQHLRDPEKLFQALEACVSAKP